MFFSRTLCISLKHIIRKTLPIIRSPHFNSSLQVFMCECWIGSQVVISSTLVIFIFFQDNFISVDISVVIVVVEGMFRNVDIIFCLYCINHNNYVIILINDLWKWLKMILQYSKYVDMISNDSQIMKYGKGYLNIRLEYLNIPGPYLKIISIMFQCVRFLHHQLWKWMFHFHI